MVHSSETRATISAKGKAYWDRKRKSGNGGFKLTNEQIAEIRRDYRRWSYLESNAKELAEKYGVGHHSINRIVSGKQRRHP
jgi:hypothetical protein